MNERPRQAGTSERQTILAAAGIDVVALGGVGAVVHGLALAGPAPAAPVRGALEQEMAERGFLVFPGETYLSPKAFLRASCWWGGRALHSTHSIHPATPEGNPHIFRLSNDPQEGIPGVGPQWHNDGSFLPETFSHAGYHMVHRAPGGGGTEFAHQGAAFDALPEDQQAYFATLASVNSNTGVVHPLVHVHPRSGRLSLWLHLGMTGAVVERQGEVGALRLLEEDEVRALCQAYNAVLNAGFARGDALRFEYGEGDCVFVDNLAVAHRATAAAHQPRDAQGLRILHRSTVRGEAALAPRFGLPQRLAIRGPRPAASGLWLAGGVGFRWDETVMYQN